MQHKSVRKAGSAGAGCIAAPPVPVCRLGLLQNSRWGWSRYRKAGRRKAPCVGFFEQCISNKQSEIIDNNFNKLSVLAAKIDATSPLKTLSRGYSIAQTENKVIKSVDVLEKGMNFSLILSDGVADCKTVSVKRSKQ